MSRNFLLAALTLGVFGILIIMIASYHQRQESFPQNIANSIDEATEEIKDEIDDHTTAK